MRPGSEFAKSFCRFSGGEMLPPGVLTRYQKLWVAKQRGEEPVKQRERKGPRILIADRMEFIVDQLRTHGAMTPAEICASMPITSKSSNRILNAMCAAGLIEYERATRLGRGRVELKK